MLCEFYLRQDLQAEMLFLVHNPIYLREKNNTDSCAHEPCRPIVILHHQLY